MSGGRRRGDLKIMLKSSKLLLISSAVGSLVLAAADQSAGGASENSLPSCSLSIRSQNDAPAVPAPQPLTASEIHAGQVLVTRGGVILHQSDLLAEAIRAFIRQNDDAYLSAAALGYSPEGLPNVASTLENCSSDFHYPLAPETWLEDVLRNQDRHHLLVLDIRASGLGTGTQRGGAWRKRMLQRWTAAVLEARHGTRVSVLAIADEFPIAPTSELSHRLSIPLLQLRSSN